MSLSKYLKQGILREYPSLIPTFMQLSDIGITTGLFWFFHQSMMLHITFRLTMILLPIVLSFIFSSYKLYQQWRGNRFFNELGKVCFAWLTVLASLMLLFFFLQSSFTVSSTGETVITWFFARIQRQWVFSSLFILLFYRILLQQFFIYLRRLGKNQRMVVIIGAGNLGLEAQRILNQNSWTGFKIVAFFDDDPTLQNKELSGVSVVGSIDEIANYLRNNIVDVILVTLPFRAEEKIQALLRDTMSFQGTISLVPDIYSFRLLNYSLSEVAGLPIINLTEDPFKANALILKWLEDKILSTVILTLISPLLLIIAIGIKLSSPGPVVFKQRRYGKGGKEFTLYKFRSMRTDSPNISKDQQATKNDPRVTPFGGFLRRTSLDELPQFFNVLKGDMSIVGPRPHMVEHNEKYKDQVEAYVWRHKVKPGLTGLAQVEGYRGETETLWKMEKRVELDLKYIHNWSLWLDLKIVISTIFKGFVGSNAY